MPKRAHALTVSAAVVMALTACGSSGGATVNEQSSTTSTSTSSPAATSSTTSTTSPTSSSSTTESTSTAAKAPDNAKLVLALKKAGCKQVPLRQANAELAAKGIGSLGECKGDGTIQLRGFSVRSNDLIEPTFRAMTKNQTGETIYYIEGDGWGIAASPDGSSNPTKVGTEAIRTKIGEGTVKSYETD